MSEKIHRRDFFKYGMCGAAMALAGGASTTGEETPPTRTRGRNGHPWWVRQIDKPKLAIDDEVYARFDPNEQVFSSLGRHIGRDKARELSRIGQEKTAQYFRDKTPGFRIQDRALAEAARILGGRVAPIKAFAPGHRSR